MLTFKCDICGKQWDDVRMERQKNTQCFHEEVFYGEGNSLKSSDQNCFECSDKIKTAVTEATEKAEAEAREKVVAEIQAAIV